MFHLTADMQPTRLNPAHSHRLVIPPSHALRGMRPARPLPIIHPIAVNSASLPDRHAALEMLRSLAKSLVSLPATNHVGGLR